MKKILFWLYQPYAWLFFIPLTCVLSFIAGWLVALCSVIINPRFASQQVAARWARLVSWLTPMIVAVEGEENTHPDRTYVVVSNHASQYDILLVYGWLRLDLKWVIKKEVRKLPGIGIGCEKAGHIFIDRRRPEQAKRAVNEALSRLGDGVGILFFAEGTRSLDGKLLPFKKGAFRIAMDHQLPVLPVTLLGTRDILPAKTLRLFPGRARMIIHPAIEPGEMDLRGLMQAARVAITSALPEEKRTT